MRKVMVLLFMMVVGVSARLPIASAAETGLVGHWDFDEGSGSTVNDTSGSKFDGQVHNAEWAKAGKGSALRFNGTDSYVDCGKNNALTNLTGDITILAWVKLEASPFPNNTTNWHIVHCEDYGQGGYMLRVDGSTSKLTYRTNQGKANQYGFSRVSLDNNTFHHVAVVKKGEKATYYVDSMPDLEFAVKDPLPSTVPFRIGSEGQSFQGLIDEVKVYSRALSISEILRQYKQGAADHGKDTSWFGKLKLTPYPYFSDGKLDIEVSFLGVLPLQQDEEAVVEFGKRGDKAIQQKPDPERLATGKCDFTFNTDTLAAGDYVVRAAVKIGDKAKAEASYAFRYPPPQPEVLDPTRKLVSPLPKPQAPVPYKVAVTPNGGLSLTVSGKETYPVESLFSYPNGGDNAFHCSPEADPKAEPAWKVSSRQVRPTEYAVKGEGQFYRVDRSVFLTSTHVTIKDTITNKTVEPIGIILSNRLGTEGREFNSTHLAGRSVSGAIENESIKSNPTLFLGRQDLGVGLVALDDVFIVQSRAFRKSDAAGILTNEFALDSKATYTLEWAIYLNSTGDYFDFINQVRRDEGRNNVTVEGGFAFISRGAIPPKGYIEVRDLKYLSLACLSAATDDPKVSLEGIEFMEYPKEKAVIKEQFAKLQKDYPDIKLMFHVAHSLYANNKPEQLFPDSRVIDANGKQPVYPYTYDSYGYFSKERVDDNWRWWIYYPTKDNSFGKALLKSVDVMMNELGCKGAFMDGFMIAYGGEYTYDRWDGHTAEIDPKTKTIKRKMGSVLLLSQDVLAEVCQKMRAKGGTVIANGAVVTRTIGREPIPHDLEITEGSGVHLAPAPCCLGNPFAITCESDIHKDVIAKLKAANLYFYYGEKGVTYPGAPSQMYPITIEELHSGYIKGKQRLITIHPGVYGWAGDRNLHFGYLYDDRGHMTTHNFITTVDSSSVRTQVDLQENQIAILKKIPLTLQSTNPVNVLVQQYGAQDIQLFLNGKGKAQLTVGNGDFLIKPGSKYRVTAGAVSEVAADRSGLLAIPLSLTGPTQVKLEPVSVPE